MLWRTIHTWFVTKEKTAFKRVSKSIPGCNLDVIFIMKTFVMGGRNRIRESIK